MSIAEGTSAPLVWLGGAWSKARTLAAKRHHIVAAADGIDRYDLVGEGEGAAAALKLALERPQNVQALVLVGPTLLARDGAAADAALAGRLGELKLPCLAMFGTLDPKAPVEAARHWRARMPHCNLVYVYDAGAAMADERPEAVASLLLDFLERHDLFLVRRESDLINP